MKKLLGLIFLLLLPLSGCGLETKTLTELYEKDLTEVNKIIIIEGSKGTKKTTTNKKVIVNFIDEIQNIKFVPDENQEPRKGYKYSIILYEGDETFQFELNHVNGYYYKTEPDLYPIVDDFYKNLDVEE